MQRKQASWVAIAALVLSLLHTLLFGSEAVETKVPAVISSFEKVI